MIIVAEVNMHQLSASIKLEVFIVLVMTIMDTVCLLMVQHVKVYRINVHIHVCRQTDRLTDKHNITYHNPAAHAPRVNEHKQINECIAPLTKPEFQLILHML